MPQSVTITVNSRWRRKQVPIEVIVNRATSPMCPTFPMDKTFSGKLPQWLFLQDFQSIGRSRRRGAEPPSTTKAVFIAHEQ
jgi:hypothetical protein